MKSKLAAAAVVLLSFATHLRAHRLDEYLQAALVSLAKDRVEVSLRMVPGVAVSSNVLASVDTDANGGISPPEERAYAERVLRDLSLSSDGSVLKPDLISVTFPKADEVKAGLGEIHIEFAAKLPSGGANRKLILENHHRPEISVYLVNCLVPSDRDIKVIAQNRNENQSVYELDYAQAGGRAGLSRLSRWPNIGEALGNLDAFPSMVRLGMRHIAQGTDHLLFLLVLLLPAPLLVRSSRWFGAAGARHGLMQILRVVTAFTAGHSVTLALAAFGLVRVPSRPIEVLIAISILVSAVHAIRPLFPGREAGIAAFFGLFHGLAFASTLGNLGLGRWERVVSLFGFNLGIETMQLLVVAAIMPSLLLLSRSRVYSSLRIVGALFAGYASLCWTAERLLDAHTSVDVIVNSVAQHGVWVATVLFGISLAGWRLRSAGEQTGPSMAGFVSRRVRATVSDAA